MSVVCWWGRIYWILPVLASRRRLRLLARCVVGLGFRFDFPDWAAPADRAADLDPAVRDVP